MELQNRTDISLKSIQLLRALAALGVVYCHYALYASPQAATGAFGVDIFFVISGFIIAFVISKTTKDFFLKRIIRIVPLYFIATTVTVVSAVIFPQWFYNTTITLEAIIKSILFIPYRIGKSGPILIAGWTLNFEMFFYLIAAFCILITNNKNKISLLCASILVVIIIALAFFEPANYALEFYRTGLFPEFIYGLFLFHFYTYYTTKLDETSNNDKQNKATEIVLLIIGTLSLSSLILYELPAMADSQISSNRNIQFGIPALFLVGSVLLLEKKIKNSRLTELGLLLGDSSYAMYLFHPYFIYFLQRVVYPNIFSTSEYIFIIELLKLLLAVFVTAGGSVLIFRLIDNPIQNCLRTIRKKIN